MKSFSALDEILSPRALAPAPAREVAASGGFQPLFAAKALDETAKGEDAATHAAPEIQLVEVDGRVQQIIVTCPCGERTVLECAY